MLLIAKKFIKTGALWYDSQFLMTDGTDVMLVAFDTIFGQCSVAILCDGQLVYHESILGARGQTELILPMLEKALTCVNAKATDVQGWAFNRGPGAFSGIRINTAVVQALSVANDAPCLAVSSLHALAYCAHWQHNFTDGTKITALIDARQNQVYAGNFIINNGQVSAFGDNHEYLADYHSEMVADVVVGDGVDLVQTHAQKLTAHPTAEHIAYLAYPLLLQGKAVTAENALPVYLRNNAWKTLEQQGKS